VVAFLKLNFPKCDKTYGLFEIFTLMQIRIINMHMLKYSWHGSKHKEY